MLPAFPGANRKWQTGLGVTGVVSHMVNADVLLYGNSVHKVIKTDLFNEGLRRQKLHHFKVSGSFSGICIQVCVHMLYMDWHICNHQRT